MKFWELISIMRTQSTDLNNLLREKKWSQFLAWYNDMTRIVNAQDRFILDYKMPEELALAAMALVADQFQLRNGRLTACPSQTASHKTLSALDAYTRYGGAAIEEVLERGVTKVPHMKARIRWKTPSEGGRIHLPLGDDSCSYCPIIEFSDESKQSPNSWSLVVEKIESIDDFEWLANVRFLVAEAPAADLRPHRKFGLYEGAKCVATGVLLEE